MVINCEDCKHYGEPIVCGDGCCHGEACFHPDAPEENMLPIDTPPDWCPLLKEAE
jgi:hypothetical protein